MKNALKKCRGGEGAKMGDDTGSQVDPQPSPLARNPFLQARPTTTPRPWIKAASKRRLKARGEDKAGRWDALAGSQAAMTTKKASSCTCD